MKIKLLLVFVLSVLMLSACGVGESQILYNKYYEDVEVTSVSCGRGNQLKLSIEGKEQSFQIKEDDCHYLINYRNSLKRLGKDTNIHIDFISDGYSIDGIILTDNPFTK